LRDAVAPVTTRAIVEAVMAAKTLPADDSRARELIHKTVLGSLHRAMDTIERTQAAGSAAWRAIKRLWPAAKIRKNRPVPGALSLRRTA
jgi:hypothetical protein